MKYEPKQTNIQYTALFSKPYFAIFRQQQDIVEAIYQGLSDRYLVRLSDISINASNNYADYKIIVTLFRGVANIEVSLERLHFNFQNLRTDDDVDFCKGCIDSFQAAFFSTLSNAFYPDVTQRTFSATSILGVVGGSEQIDTFFSDRLEQSYRLKEFREKMKRLNYAFRASISFENHDLSFSLEPSIFNKDDLFYNCQCIYNKDAAFEPFLSQAENFEVYYLNILAHIGLERMPQATSSEE